jgi:hypothetical protein
VAGARRGRGASDGEHGDSRGVGNLVGAGPSIVGVSGSMRARDISRPTPEQIEQALDRLVIRRRPVERPGVPVAPKPAGPKPGPPT